MHSIISFLMVIGNIVAAFFGHHTGVNFVSTPAPTTTHVASTTQNTNGNITTAEKVVENASSTVKSTLPDIIYQNDKGDVIIVPLNQKEPATCKAFGAEQYNDCWQTKVSNVFYVAPNGNTGVSYSTQSNGIYDAVILKDLKSNKQIVTSVQLHTGDKTSAGDDKFTWSPNGRYISWTRYLPGSESGKTSGYQINYIDITDPTFTVRIIANCTSYSWAADSNHLVCYDWFTSSMSRVSIQNPTVENIHFIDGVSPFCTHVAIAPDSKSLVCNSSSSENGEKITLYQLDSQLNASDPKVLFDGEMVLNDNTVLVPIHTIVHELLYSSDSKYLIYFSAAPGIIDLSTGKISHKGPHVFETLYESIQDTSPKWKVNNNFRIPI